MGERDKEFVLWILLGMATALLICVVGGLAWMLLTSEEEKENERPQPVIELPSPTANQPSAFMSPSPSSTPRPTLSPTPPPSQTTPYPSSGPVEIPPEAAEYLKPLEGLLFIENELIIKFREGVGEAEKQTFYREYNLIPLDEIKLLRLVRVKVEGRSAVDAFVEIWGDPRIEYATFNFFYTTSVEPNDPHYPKQWNLRIINAPAGWDISTGGEVTIAIIDSGVDMGHPDLAAKIVPGYDFVNDDPDPSDDNGHGTHVAGIAAAITNNGEGVAGVAWAARIMPIKVMNEKGTGTTWNMAKGITWAVDKGARILNLSIGGPCLECNPLLKDIIHHPGLEAIDYAYERGALIVAAAGNEYDAGNIPEFPASYQHVLAVGAITNQNTHPSYSNAGTYVDVSAPGGEMENLHSSNGIFSTMPTYEVYLTKYEGYHTGYDAMVGTSMAAPHVTGLAALIWAVNPSLTNDQVQAIIEYTTDDLGPPGWDGCFGTGRINVARALESARSGSIPPRGPREHQIALPLFCEEFTIPVPTVVLPPLPTLAPLPTLPPLP